jgi:hypothetical protein
LDLGLASVRREGGNFVDGEAMIARYVIAGTVWITDLLATHPTNEQSETWLCLVNFLTITTVKLISITRNTLLALTILTRNSAKLA